MARPRKASTEPSLGKAESLLSDSSVATRTKTTSAIASEYSSGGMTERQRRVAEGILEIMARDVEQNVREALSRQVKSCPFLPHTLAMTLADDIESVSLPMIQFSSVLSEIDLISIIDTGNVNKQVAVAKRKSVSQRVSERLVDTENETVVGTLLANDGADISERSYVKVATTFPGNEKIQALMADRPSLPLSVIERLISSVTVELRERIVNRHDFPAELADRIVADGRESALTRSISGEARVAEVEGLIIRLKSKGQLTPTLILRSLCEGDIHFFEAAIAALAGISIDKARPFLYQRGAGGMRMLFRNTGLPNEMFRAVKVAMDEVNAIRILERGPWQKEFGARIVQRLVEEYDDLAPTDIDSVLSQLSHRILGRWEEEPHTRIAPSRRW